jgi:hypothetical protein
MRTHRHRSPLDGDRNHATFCSTCGEYVVWIAASPDRMGYWRAVRRVAARSSRSVSPSRARLDNTEAGWTESELREAYGR